MDEHYPLIDIDSFRIILSNGTKVDQFDVGGSNIFVLRGTRPVGQRILVLRNDLQFDYNYATSVAYKAGCMDGLMEWYEKNKGWKEGGYVAHSPIERSPDNSDKI